MALTVATGFVVDDAIVVVENVMRHIEHGMGVLEATLTGAKEIGFTVLSMSISLVAVFIPILLMGGIVVRPFREFAVVLSVSVRISLAIRSEEHTSELQSRENLVCRLLLEKKKHNLKH